MAITHSYVDFGAGSDATGDGSIGLPWKTLQWAYDTCVRNVADGNQINVQSGTAQVLAAPLNLTTFIAGGALSANAPLVTRGYTSAANDGGAAEINCNGATMWVDGTYDYVILADLQIHSPGNNHCVGMDSACVLYRCDVHKGTSSPSAKNLVYLGTDAIVIGCHIHDPGAGTGMCIRLGGQHCFVLHNYCDMGVSSTGECINAPQSIIVGNIVKCGRAEQTGITAATVRLIAGNVVYNSAAGTSRGIYSTSSAMVAMVQNNIICGWSGAGGDGIEMANSFGLGFNAFYNNTNPITVTDQKFIDLTANDVTLAADPFVDAAAGDFSLTAAAKTALRGVGWPAAYLGAHANTDGHITIGAIQYGEAEAGGGGAVRRAMRMIGG